MQKQPFFLRLVDQIENRLLVAEKFLFMLLVTAMTAVTLIEVLIRYVFHTTLLVGVSELINWCFVWIVFIGMGTLVRTGEHIGISYFFDKFPRIVQCMVKILLNGALIAFFLVVAITGIPFAISQSSILTTAANIPKTYLYLSVPVGALLLCYHLFAEIVRLCVKQEEENEE